MKLDKRFDRQFYEVYRDNAIVSSLVTQIQRDTDNVFQDTYVLDFLNLPESHSEGDLQKSITANLKNFILEFGKDFTFIGQERPFFCLWTDSF